MNYPHYIRAEKTLDCRFVLWQTNHYQYEIDVYDRKQNKIVSKLTFNTSYEEVSKYLDDLVDQETVSQYNNSTSILATQF